MKRDEIIERLRDLLLETDSRSADAIERRGEDAVLSTDLGLSSVGMLYLVISIEESFGVLFENVTMSDFVTLRDVVDYLEEKTK